jgi:hypothetical protein
LCDSSSSINPTSPSPRCVSRRRRRPGRSDSQDPAPDSEALNQDRLEAGVWPLSGRTFLRSALEKSYSFFIIFFSRTLSPQVVLPYFLFRTLHISCLLCSVLAFCAPSPFLQELLEFLDGETGVANDTAHRVFIDRVMARVVRMRLPSLITMCLP